MTSNLTIACNCTFFQIWTLSFVATKSNRGQVEKRIKCFYYTYMWHKKDFFCSRSPARFLRRWSWKTLVSALFIINHQCLPWEPPALFLAKKAFFGFGISWMSITWIVLCFLASSRSHIWQSKNRKRLALRNEWA